jgi:uncharacterized membrane protein YfcA
MVPAFALLYWLTDNQMRPLLGVLILAMLALELARAKFGWADVPHRWWFAGGAGFLAGFGTMVGNAGGPPMTLYLLSRGLVKEQFVGTCAWFFFLLNLTKVVPFWWQGMVTARTLSAGLWLIPAVLAGAGLGLWLLPRVPQKVFNILVSIFAAAAAAWLILGGSSSR